MISIRYPPDSAGSSTHSGACFCLDGSAWSVSPDRQQCGIFGGRVVSREAGTVVAESVIGYRSKRKLDAACTVLLLSTMFGDDRE